MNRKRWKNYTIDYERYSISNDGEKNYLKNQLKFQKPGL